MKKIILLGIAILLFAFAPLNAYYPDDYMNASAVKTTDAQILAGAGYCYGVFFTTDATNDVTVDIYDSLTATGTKIVPQFIVTTSANSRAAAVSFDPPVEVSTGIFVDITLGAGTVSYVVYYRTQ